MWNKLYTYYCLTIGLIIFLLFYPIQLLFLQFKQTHFIANKLNYWAIHLMLFLWFFDIEIEGKKHIKRKGNYVLVGNHGSYLDIPMMFLVNRTYGKFVGKSSLKKIPLFGYMYKKLYIMVNRRDANSRQRVFDLSKEALKNNRNIIIFPEGTIPNKNLPKMLPFKEGAFKIAIETNTPIVPVSMPNNWKILSENKPLRIKRHIFAAKVHQPIETKDLTLEDLNPLRQKVYQIIEDEIKKHWNEDN